MRQDRVGAAECVQHRPVVDVLDGVVRPVVAAPALDAFEIAAVVEVPVEELLAGAGLARNSSRSRSAQPGGAIGVSIRTVRQSARRAVAGMARSVPPSRRVRHTRHFHAILSSPQSPRLTRVRTTAPDRPTVRSLYDRSALSNKSSTGDRALRDLALPEMAEPTILTVVRRLHDDRAQGLEPSCRRRAQILPRSTRGGGW